MKSVEPRIAGFIQRTNAKFVTPKIRAMLSRRIQPLRSARSNITREQNTAVNRFSTRPRMSVIANPFS